MTETEAFEHLQNCAARLFSDGPLSERERKWLALGIFAMCRGDSLNDAFAVKKARKPDYNVHCVRWIHVEKHRATGMSNNAAFKEATNSLKAARDAMPDRSDTVLNRAASGGEDAVRDSWELQNEMQRGFERNPPKGGK